MIWLKIYFLFFCFYFGQSKDTCQFQDACRCILNSTDTIDLTAIGSSTKFPRFYEVSFGNCSSSFAQLYSYNPCYGFDSTDVNVVTKKGFEPCTSAAACVRTSGGNQGEKPEEYAIGLQKNTQFGFDEKKGIYIEYPFPPTKTNLRVYLICSASIIGHVLTMVEEYCDGEGQMVFNLTSKCCCPNGCLIAIPKASPGGLSTGSVLLITFFTLLIAYLIVGILWNLFNGAQGVEMLPNLQFWNELPTLVVEGISFTFSCCGRKATYGEV